MVYDRNIVYEVNLKKPIVIIRFIKVNETQRIIPVSPRRYFVHSTYKPEKIPYTDHFKIEALFEVNETAVNNVSTDSIDFMTTVTMKSRLNFVKNVKLIKSKVEGSYNKRLQPGVDKHLKHRLTSWLLEQAEHDRKIS